MEIQSSAVTAEASSQQAEGEDLIDLDQSSIPALELIATPSLVDLFDSQDIEEELRAKTPEEKVETIQSRPVDPSTDRADHDARIQDPLLAYLADIDDHDLLPLEQQLEKGKRIYECTKASLESLLRQPAYLRILVEKWKNDDATSLFQSASETDDSPPEHDFGDRRGVTQKSLKQLKNLFLKKQGPKLSDLLDKVEETWKELSKLRDDPNEEQASAELAHTKILDKIARTIGNIEVKNSFQESNGFEELLRISTEISSALAEPTSDTSNARRAEIESRICTSLEEFQDSVQPLIERTEAVNDLIKYNYAMVVSIAKKYKNSWVQLNDLIQDGNLGLIQAAKNYDYRYETNFSTTATRCIRSSIVQGIQNSGRNVRLPSHVHSSLLHDRRETARLEQELRRPPELAERSGRLGVEVEKLESLELVTQDTSSLSGPVNLHDSEDASELIEIIPNSTSPSPLEGEISIDVNRLLDPEGILGPKEIDLLRRRYLMDQDQKTVGKLYQGVSNERNRQIEVKALRKLKKLYPNLRTYLIEG